MIVGTPRPGSPTIRAQAPWNSTSLEALEWLPSLSFKRWMWKALRRPSGSTRGIKKQEGAAGSPRPFARARGRCRTSAPSRTTCGRSISYSAPAPPPFSARATVVLARTSEPPCFSVIAMPAIAEPFSAAGMRHRVVRRRGDQRLPLGRQLRLRAQRGHHREGHRDRAGEAGLGLHRGHVQRGAGDVRRGLGAPPRQRVQLVLHAHPHQVVPCGVELDLVDAVAVAVVRAEDRLVLVSQTSPELLWNAADELAQARRRARAPNRRPRAPVASTNGRLLEKTSTPSSGGAWLATS